MPTVVWSNLYIVIEFADTENLYRGLPLKKHHKKGGMSAVAMLFALGVVSFLIKIVVDFYSGNIVVLRSQQNSRTAKELERYVQVGLSCPAAGPAWAVTKEIEIPRRNGVDPPLISTGTAYTFIGGSCLRAVVTAITPTKEFDVQRSDDCKKWKSILTTKIKCP